MREELISKIGGYLPVLFVALVVIASLWALKWALFRRSSDLGAEARLPRQLVMIALAGVGSLIVLLVIPMSDATRGQILSLLGLVLTAVLAISSTTFVTNAMAGWLLRVVNSFRPGDFVRVEDKFGRVTERGLFYTEIQTEDRDLTTFPNIYLVRNPITVVHGSGTIISATLSLGYDVPRVRIEELLKQAAEEAGLQDPFVLVMELGDFSVSYRIAGFLPEVKQLLTARSNLRKKVMDLLHGNGIEIVSPAFMNQRRVSEDKKFLPEKEQTEAERPSPAPEDIMFEKAEEAGEVERLREELAGFEAKLDQLKALKKASAAEKQDTLDAKIRTVQQRKDAIAAQINVAGKPDNGNTPST